MIDALTSVGALEWLAVVAGLAYVLLAARENIWCWPMAFIGTGASMIMLWNVSLVMDSALNLFYLIMALYGFWQWRFGGQNHSPRQVVEWPWSAHAIILISVVLLTCTVGYWLDVNTQAAWPYVDTATTAGAVITTFMVTHKVLENWLYWIVIDAVSVWIYLERGLLLYALLFALYTVIAVLGFVAWRKSMLNKASL